MAQDLLKKVRFPKHEKYTKYAIRTSEEEGGKNGDKCFSDY